MAKFGTDFSEYTTGAQPTGWTRQTDTGVGTWRVENLSGALGGKVLRYTADDEVVRPRLTFDNIGIVEGDVELLVKWRRDTGLTIGSLVGTLLIHGDYTSSPDEYRSEWRLDSSSSGQTRRIEYVDGGSETSLTSANSQGVPASGTWYWQRFQRTGTTLRSRWWEDGSSEPGTWLLSTTHSGLSSGLVGVGPFLERTLPIIYEIDFFGVGTGSDGAPNEPLTQSLENFDATAQDNQSILLTWDIPD